jgi:hypothetical protein
MKAQSVISQLSQLLDLENNNRSQILGGRIVQIAGTVPVRSQIVLGSEKVGARSNLFGSGRAAFLFSSNNDTAPTLPVFFCRTRVELRSLFSEAAGV